MDPLNDNAQEALQNFLNHFSKMANRLPDSGLSAEEKEEFLEKSKVLVGQCCEMDMKHKRNLNLLKQAEEKFATGDGAKSPQEIYHELESKHSNKNVDFEEHDAYMNMLEFIEDARRDAGLGGEDNESRAGEDGLLVSQVQISTIDPITKKEMVDPFKSQKCGHAFEKSSIYSLLKNKPSIRCPIGGCGHHVSSGDLIPDYQMKRLIQRRKDQM